MDLNSTMQFVADGTQKAFDLTFHIYPEDTLIVYFDSAVVESDQWELEYETAPQKVTFQENIPDGTHVLIRRSTDMREIPHVFELTGNVRGGAEFNAENMDENFDKIRRGVEDAMDSFNLVGVNAEIALNVEEDRIKAEAAAAAAQASETQAGQYRTQAGNSASAASGSASQAASSASAAAASESQSASSEANAAASEAAAEGYRDDAADSAAASESSRQAADASASVADTSQQQAATSASNALDYRNQSSTYAGQAGSSASAAEQAKGDAETARDKAQQWADNDEDVPVESGKFSAKHWAAKAQGISDLELYAKLAGGAAADFDLMPMVGGTEIVEAGDNANGYYVVLAGGGSPNVQICWGSKLVQTDGTDTPNFFRTLFPLEYPGRAHIYLGTESTASIKNLPRLASFQNRDSLGFDLSVIRLNEVPFRVYWVAIGVLQ